MIKKIFSSIVLTITSLFATSISISYNYDTIDRVTSISYTTGQSAAYTYDTAGNMTRVTTSGSYVDCDDSNPLTVDRYNSGTSSCEHLSDSDGDGIENTSDTNPHDGPYGNPDGDSQRNELDSDDDNDGMPDSYEQQYSNWLNQWVNDANDDADGDKVSNIDEYKAGSSPIDKEDVPNKPKFYPTIINYLLG